MKRHLQISLAVAALLFAVSAAHAQDNPAIEQHMAIATKAAKADLLGALGLCKTATAEPVVGFMDNYNKMSRSRRSSRCR